MQNQKYFRIQGRETAYRTGKPVGIFVLTWRKVRDGLYTEEDKKIYLDVDKWFKENLPEPPFYGDNNENLNGAITYFKTDNSELMVKHITPLVELLDKYQIPYDVVYTNYVGKIVYEDEYQVGVVDSDSE